MIGSLIGLTAGCVMLFNRQVVFASVPCLAFLLLELLCSQVQSILMDNARVRIVIQLSRIYLLIWAIIRRSACFGQ